MNPARNDRPAAVESHGLGKRYSGRWALRDVDLRVEPLTIYGFLGRNGAGKTTAIRLILGLLHPSAGSVSVFGHDVAGDRIAAARQVGSLVEARATYDQLTGRDNLDITRRLLGLPGAEIDRVLEIVEMRYAADRKVGHYSLGMRQRLGLARALLGGPRLLVLDEPMNGLDPAGMRDMRAVIRQMPERCGATVFLSSHLLNEVQRTVSHVGLMHDGRLMLQGPIDEVLGCGASELAIRTSDAPAAMRALLVEGYAPRLGDGGVSVSLRGNDDAETAAINRRLVEAGVDVAALSAPPRSLEDLFAAIELSSPSAA